MPLCKWKMGGKGLDENHRRGAVGGRRGYSLLKEEISPQYLNIPIQRNRGSTCAFLLKDINLQPVGYIWLTEVLLFFCFWSVHLFLVKYLPIHKKQKILHFKL